MLVSAGALYVGSLGNSLWEGIFKGRRKKCRCVNGSSVATRWLQRHGAVKATVCPYAPTHCSLSIPCLYVLRLYIRSTVHSSCCMSIYMHAIAQHLYPSTVCVYSIPSAPSYPCVYIRAYPPYYVIALLILLFCHPTILFTL